MQQSPFICHKSVTVIWMIEMSNELRVFITWMCLWSLLSVLGLACKCTNLRMPHLQVRWSYKYDGNGNISTDSAFAKACIVLMLKDSLCTKCKQQKREYA